MAHKPGQDAGRNIVHRAQEISKAGHTLSTSLHTGILVNSRSGNSGSSGNLGIPIGRWLTGILKGLAGLKLHSYLSKNVKIINLILTLLKKLQHQNKTFLHKCKWIYYCHVF